ncbi:uncharacterized protein LOC144866533 [Branchiostoma floridae x Branchiostoma japonicum]
MDALGIMFWLHPHIIVLAFLVTQGLCLDGLSHLDDFTAEVVLDRFSNRFANITLVAAVGSLEGTITPLVTENQHGVSGPFSFELLVDSPSKVTSVKRVFLPSNIHGHSRLCLSPLSRPDMQICKKVPFVEEPIGRFLVPSEPMAKLRASEGQKQRSNNGTARSFREYMKLMNPSQWFDGVQTPLEGAAIVVDVFLLVVPISGFVASVISVLYLRRRCVRQGLPIQATTASC